MAEEKHNGAVAATERPVPRPFEQFEREFQEMRRRMFDFFRRPIAPVFEPVMPVATEWTPTVDAYEMDGAFVVKAELPGVTKDDISVAIDDGLLTIKGKREKEEKVEKARYYAWERFTGVFTRSFALPEGIDPTTIEATYKDGILEVRVPLPSSTKPEAVKIPVKG